MKEKVIIIVATQIVYSYHEEWFPWLQTIQGDSGYGGSIRD